MSDPVRITNPGAESLGYDSDGHEIMAVDIYVNPPRVDVFHGVVSRNRRNFRQLL
ncbi:hypothetical protein ACV2CD_16895 [Salmonella enterica subsp. enterica serovar Typhimurium]